MRNRHSTIAILFLVLCGATTSAAPLPRVVFAGPVARLELISTTLQEDDPLVMAFSLTNDSKTTMTLKRRLDIREGDVVFEVRSLDEKVFRAVPVQSQRFKVSNCHVGHVKIPEHSLAYRECDRRHVVLMLDDQTDLPLGKCFIRARVKTQSEDVVSEEYGFQITEVPEKTKEALSTIKRLYFGSPLSPAYSTEMPRLKKAMPILEGSIRGKVLRNRMLAYEAAGATPGDELEKVMARIA
jgi:hypothetical protein